MQCQCRFQILPLLGLHQGGTRAPARFSVRRGPLHQTSPVIHEFVGHAVLINSVEHRLPPATLRHAADSCIWDTSRHGMRGSKACRIAGIPHGPRC
jgi:hypothetical protein